MSEETANQLRQQLKDQREQNEELEFRLFELEETSEKVRTVRAGVVIQFAGSSSVHCVSKNDIDVAHYKFNPHQPIMTIFGRDVAESVHYRTTVCYPTSTD